MAEPIISKRCSKCKKTKPLSEFYKNRSKKDGLATECKICYSQYQKSNKGKVVQKRHRQTKKCKTSHKRYRQSEKGRANQKRYRQSEKGKAYYKRFRIRHFRQCKAAEAIMYAVRIGKLPKPDTLQCYYCTKNAKEYHHPDYFKPLDVVPVCVKCHNKLR